MDTAREYGFARWHYASESLACVVLLFTRPVMERRQDAIEQRNEHEKRESVSQDGIKIMAALRRTTESVELVGNSWCVYFISFTSCWPMPCSWSYFPSFRLRVGRISLFHQNNPIVRRGARGITVYPLIRLPAGGGERGWWTALFSIPLRLSLSFTHKHAHTIR